MYPVTGFVRDKDLCLLNRMCFCIMVIVIYSGQELQAQNIELSDNTGWFSLGGRSTLSLFSDDGSGVGTGGQFRIQLSNSVNTDWFADYIVVTNHLIRSEYYHIGWSLLYYPFEKLQYPEYKVQPYILAGHCFDYNRKTVVAHPEVSKDRWGSAVQAGAGAHLNLTEKFDIAITCQYMIHLTKELEAQSSGDVITISDRSGSSLEGHLLATISFNYKVFRLWKK